MQRSVRMVVGALALGVSLSAAEARADLAPLGCGCGRSQRTVQVDPACADKSVGAACGDGGICQFHGPYYESCDPSGTPSTPDAGEPDAGVQGMSVPPVWVALVGLWAIARRRLRQ